MALTVESKKVFTIMLQIRQALLSCFSIPESFFHQRASEAFSRIPKTIRNSLEQFPNSQSGIWPENSPSAQQRRPGEKVEALHCLTYLNLYFFFVVQRKTHFTLIKLKWFQSDFSFTSPGRKGRHKNSDKFCADVKQLNRSTQAVDEQRDVRKFLPSCSKI